MQIWADIASEWLIGSAHSRLGAHGLPLRAVVGKASQKSRSGRSAYGKLRAHTILYIVIVLFDSFALDICVRARETADRCVLTDLVGNFHYPTLRFSHELSP